jgi:hypothetical protein
MMNSGRSFRWSEANGEIGRGRPLHSAPAEPLSRRTEEKKSHENE